MPRLEKHDSIASERPAAAAKCLHIDLDSAWPAEVMPPDSYLDASAWGPALRFTTRPEFVEGFHAEIKERAGAFTLFGSGDFHHLTALWLRRMTRPFILISFDNHPDWDVRPPLWCCGGWINRALEIPHLKAAHIWGLGNFELRWPHRLFACHDALRSRRLAVNAWSEVVSNGDRNRWSCVTRQNWREAFARFSETLAGEIVYITIDLDCLAKGESVTNWENGLFTAGDVAWAISRLRATATIEGGDLCGAYSPPLYARWRQRLAARIDHPAPGFIDRTESERINLAAFAQIWPVLTGAN